MDYQLLRGHRRTDGSWKTGRQLRMQYIQLTDRLIFRITEERPNTVIFLDKSARPVAWLVQQFWPILAGSEKKPAIRFLNIDRLHWVNRIDPEGVGSLDVTRLDPGVIRSLRSVFVEPRFKRGGLTAEIDTAPAALDDQHVLVVDEVYSSGRTTRIASDLIRRAFRDVTVDSAHWMQGIAARGTATGNADLPVWYNESTEFGRGVGDRQVGGGTDRPTTNLTQQLGAWFLSSRLPGPDPLSLRLRQEITHLATAPDVPIRPTAERDDLAERLEQLNNAPLKEIMATIQQITRETDG